MFNVSYGVKSCSEDGRMNVEIFDKRLVNEIKYIELAPKKSCVLFCF